MEGKKGLPDSLIPWFKQCQPPELNGADLGTMDRRIPTLV